jgi:hypothetical protein
MIHDSCGEKTTTKERQTKKRKTELQKTKAENLLLPNHP